MKNRRAFLCSCVFSLVLVLYSSLPASQAMEEIQVWYGEEQQFGTPGLAQPQVNILGRVSNHDKVSSLSFRVNNGLEQPLHIGPDSRRLSAPGDFNLEIDAAMLDFGNNNIDIIRTLEDNSRDVRHINVAYQKRSWPLPYRVNWAKVDSIQDAVQVVDGNWQLIGSTIRTAADSIGYDRALALGDATWSSYEILISFTVSGVDSSAYDSSESVSPGLGLILHWNGHSDSPIDCDQPRCGWFPFGAIHWYTFLEGESGGFNINTRPINDLSVALPYELKLGNTYWLRSRVETFPFMNHYFMKVWRQGEDEPDLWSLRQAADRKNPDYGGVLIVAHHVDLTIDNIDVFPIPVRKGVSFRDYFTIFPQILTMIAALLYLLLSGLSHKFRRMGRVFVVALCFSVFAFWIYLESLLPVVLQLFPVNAVMSAALYLGYDFGSVFLQLMIWVTILWHGCVMFRNRHQESMK